LRSKLALADLHRSAKHATDARGHADRYVALARHRMQLGGDESTAAALGIGFVISGGLSGADQMPFKLIRMILGRPSSRSRLEAAMRHDKYRRQVGRALAAVAAADGQMRSRRAGLWRLVQPTPRRLFLLGSAGGGVFMAVTDEETRHNVETEARALLETLGAELSKRIDAVGN